ncbi:MAG: DedA family protein, partial [Planctomycetes bacterium]|nr:DedA family protein [Planctomycetota bacterium]
DALTYTEAVFWCFAGILAGDSILYSLGAWVGERVYHWPVLRAHMKTRHRNKFNRLFFKHGTLAVFLARFLPGFRMVAYFVAGNLGMRYWKFVLLDSVGAALTVPISVYAGFVLADNIDKAQELFHRYQLPIALACIAGLLIFLRVRGNRRIARLAELRHERTTRQNERAEKANGSEAGTE